MTTTNYTYIDWARLGLGPKDVHELATSVSNSVFAKLTNGLVEAGITKSAHVLNPPSA